MSFNIKVNGVNFFATDQQVSSSPSTFNFNRMLNDSVQVIFSTFSSYPGSYLMYNSANRTVFDSKTSYFFIVNQCDVVTNCTFKVDALGTFPNGVSASISINNVTAISNFRNGTSSITIKKNDIISSIITGSSNNQFGMNFTTTPSGSSASTSSTWFYNNLATQMIIPSVYFISPLNNSTIYRSTFAPVQLVSYPLTSSYQVELFCTSVLYSIQVPSNTAVPQNYSIPNTASGSCSFRAWIASLLQDSGLNTAPVQARAIIPTSITFSSPLNGSSYSAGTNIPMNLTSTPEYGNFTVKLTCGTLGSVSYVIISNTTNSQNYFIPQEFYGNNCTFNTFYPISATNPPTITVTQPVTLLEPKSSEIFQMNAQIPVSPRAQVAIPGTLITVRQVCGSNTTDYSNVAINSTFFIIPPFNYAGTCVFSTLTSGFYEAAPNVSITISKGTVEFTSPQGLIDVSAGTDLAIELSSSPTTGNFGVTLDCSNPSLTPVTVNIPSNTSEAQNFPIPSNYFGNICIMSITSPLDTFNPLNNLTVNVNPATVTITQPEDQSNIYVNSNITVLINTDPVSTLNPSELTLYMNCGGYLSPFENFTIGTSQQVPTPTNFTGSCLLYTLQSTYYYASTSNVTINIIKGTVEFTSPQGLIEVDAGTDLAIMLSSSPTTGTFGVTLDCNNPSLIPVTVDIPSNTSDAQNFPIPSDYYGYGCFVSITSPLNIFTTLNNFAVNIYQPVSLVLLSNSTLPANSQVRLQLQAAIQLDTLITLVQVCGSNTTTYQNNAVNTTIEVSPPVNYLGSCTFSSLANGSYTASTSTVTVHFTNSYQFLAPTNNSFVNSNSVISMNISTLLPSQIVNVTFRCPQTTPETFRVGKIISNTNATQLFYIPSNFYGNCTFSVDDLNFSGSPLFVVVTQGIWFAQPYSQSLYLTNNLVTVILNSTYLASDTVTLFQNCNGAVRNYTNVAVRQVVNATLPTNYVGACSFWTSANGTYGSIGPIFINSVSTGQVQLVSPANFSSIAAGTNMGVRLYSTISSDSSSTALSANFTVQLNCNIPGKSPYSQVVTSNTPGTVAYLVPSDFYGLHCTLSISNSGQFTAINRVNVTVTQSPSIVSPLRSSSQLTGSVVPTLLILSNPSAPSLFTLIQNCSKIITIYEKVSLDLTLQTTLPTGYIGPCSYTTLPTGFYRIATSPITVVNGSVTITDPQNQAFINAGSNLRIQLSSNLMNVNATVQLDCGIAGFAPLIVNITSNIGNWQGMSVPSNYYGTNCVLNITALPEKFFATNSLNLTITQPVTITSPLNSRTYLRNSFVPVNFTSPVNSNLPFSLNRNCSNTITTFTGLTLNTVFNAPLPVDYSGPCSFVTVASNYYLASAPVTVTIVSSPVVAFIQPLNQNFVNAVLNSTENSANFTVQLDCGIPSVSPATETIASNSSVIPQFTVPSNFYGSCSVINVPAPFSAFKTVNVTVTQPVSFELPLNQDVFNVNDPVTVLLSSPVVTSNTLNVNQNCNGAVRSYNDISINIAFNATLPTDYIGSCIFSTTAEGMYRAASPVTISAVSNPLVRIVLPTNMASVSAGSTLGVRLVSTSIAAVFSVQLDCRIPNVSPAVSQITSDLATNTPFSVPSNFYGTNCILSIINSTLYTPANTVSVVVKIDAPFVLPVRYGTYLKNDVVPMQLTSQVYSNALFTVMQVCGTSQVMFSNISLGVTVPTALPVDYTGGCSYISQAVSFYRAFSVSITVVQGTVSFTAPSNKTSVKYGNSVGVKLVSNVKAANFVVALDCNIPLQNPELYAVTSNLSSATNIVVPARFAGYNCVLSVVPTDMFKPQNTVNIRVTY